MNTSHLRERTDKIQKELDNMNVSKENIPAPVKKNNQQNKNNNKGMSVEEKNKLGNDIRTLNKEQLKGIIRILSENKEYPKSKYFEFDIDKLSIEKLRELDKYVKECLASNNNNNSHKQNTNNKIQNQKENQNNKNTNNKGSNAPNQLLKSNCKEINKNQDNKGEQISAKKIKQSTNKKIDKNNESFSSESMSSDSSLSN